MAFLLAAIDGAFCDAGTWMDFGVICGEIFTSAAGIGVFGYGGCDTTCELLVGQILACFCWAAQSLA